MFDPPWSIDPPRSGVPCVSGGVCRSLEHSAQLGTGTKNATAGNFLGTFFTIAPFSIIVNPTSGTNPGQTTVQAGIDSTVVPGPATLGMVGGAFLVLGLLRRKRVARVIRHAIGTES